VCPALHPSGFTPVETALGAHRLQDWKDPRGSINTVGMIRISNPAGSLATVLQFQKKIKLILKNTIPDNTLTYALETSTRTNRDRKQLNIFERKVYRRILGPIYDNEKENWRVLTNKEIYAILKKPTMTETIRLHRLHWFGHVLRMEENRIPKTAFI
jgi:hypothetical protein